MLTNAKGFTIVELLIAMLLGLLMGAAIISVFVYNSHSFDRDESLQRMQDDARQAIRELTTDLSMAGYLADLMLPAAVTPDGSLAVGTDCGPAAAVDWIYQAVTPGTTESVTVTMVDNATGATANAAFSCIAAADILPGTDVIAIKRVAGAETLAPVAADTVYLRTNGILGLLYHEPAVLPPAVAVPAPFKEWEYRPSIYYIRNFAIAPGDGIPTLCRKILEFGALPTMATECLAQGIENLQVEYGLDTSGDGAANVYIANPTQAQLQNMVSARIYVLARTADPDIKYTNTKTYSISNAPAYTPADNFYRRVFSITIGMHNLKTLSALRS